MMDRRADRYLRESMMDRWTDGWMDWTSEWLGKASACNAGDLGMIPGLGRSLGEGKGYLPTPVFWPR